MPTWAWIVIAAAVVVLLVAVVASVIVARRRTGRLREHFGPEHNRTLRTADSKRDAEAELQAREERRDRFDIRPLTPAARDRYMEHWQIIQMQFVDIPLSAVASAD